MASGPSDQGYTGGTAHKILRLLEPLRLTASGALLHAEVVRYLDRLKYAHGAVEDAYAGVVGQLCEALTSVLPAESVERVQLDILRERLTPPLVPDDIADLAGLVQGLAARLREAELPASRLKHALAPMFDPASRAQRTAAESPVEAPTTAAMPPLVIPAEPPVPRQTAQIPDWPELPVPAADVALDEAALDGAGRERLDTIYRHHLAHTREDLQKLLAALSAQVKETIGQNEEFGVMLEAVLASLRRSDSVEDPARLRDSLTDEVVRMLDGYNKLADKLDGTHRHLNVIEAGNRKLNDEMERIRQLSLTDDLTGLPNRRAFLRKLDEEISRVQREGAPPAIVIIDLDNFKQINDTYGHGAGDEVLRTYSRSILSIFRKHDMVARYGGEEFSALLPNTTEEGVLRALENMRKRAAETRWQCNGTVRHVPSFSAGVAIYKSGESAEVFMERADRALYRAKNLGRNRVELDRTYQQASVDDEENTHSPRRRKDD